MKWLYLFVILFCLACNGSPKQPVQINFTADHKSVSFKRLDPAILNDMARDSVNWKEVFPVYAMPADPEDKGYQKPEPGVYTLTNGAIIFTPAAPFKKGQVYFTRILNYGSVHSIGSLIRNRNLLSPPNYTDLTFKY
jgi:hypothetical protein